MLPLGPLETNAAEGHLFGEIRGTHEDGQHQGGGAVGELLSSGDQSRWAGRQAQGTGTEASSGTHVTSSCHVFLCLLPEA